MKKDNCKVFYSNQMAEALKKAGSIRYSMHKLYRDYAYAGKLVTWDQQRQIGTVEVTYLDNKIRYFSVDKEEYNDKINEINLPENIKNNDHWCVLYISGGYAVRWLIDTQIDGDLSQYIFNRKEALNKWTAQEIAEAFEPAWVKKKWGNPKQKITLRDKYLVLAAKKLLKNPTNLGDHFTLINAMLHGSIEFIGTIFTDEEKKKKYIFNKHFNSLLGEIKPDNFPKLLQICPQQYRDFLKRDYDRLQDEKKERFMQETLSLDIESNTEKIFQIGTYHRGEPKLFDFFTDGQLQLEAVCQQITQKTENTWVVGHNIFFWDFRILQKLCLSPGFISRPLWDTFFISFLLEPWKKIHALTTSAQAHKADEDAKATHALFKSQCKRIPLDWSVLKDDISLSRLQKEIASVLDQIPDRQYSKKPDFLKNDSASSGNPLYIIPESFINECAWVPGIYYDWPEGFSNREFYTIKAQDIEEMISAEDPAHSLLFQVLKDAEKNDVHVIVRMLPYWLRSHCEKIIENKSRPQAMADDSCKWRIATYESYSECLNDKNRSAFQAASHIFAPQIPVCLLRKLRHLSFVDAEKIYPRLKTVYQLAHFIHRLDAVDVEQCLNQDFHKGWSYWLEYHPIHKNEQRPYVIWAAPSQETLPSNYQSANSVEAACTYYLPELIDEVNESVHEGDFLWPTTANRLSYWNDLLSRFLSLRKSVPKEHILVLLLQHNKELDAAQKVFADLEITEGYGKHYVQQCMLLKHSLKPRCAVDLLCNAIKWQDAATALNFEVNFAVEALPLTAWSIAANDDFEKTNPSLQAIRNEDIQTEDEDDTDVDPLLIDDEDESNEERSGRSILSEEMVELCLNKFLSSWLRGNFRDAQPIILDPRITTKALKSKNFILKEFSWNALSEEQVGVLEKHKKDFAVLERKDPPQSYQDYKDYLIKYWKTSDGGSIPGFKEVQKVAIEAVLQNDNDLLVKLPTGVGKSVIFQVPALLRGSYTQKLSIVITPLRALMKDQVASLWALGFDSAVDYLSADRDPWETNDVYQGILDNRIKLLYVAPERFRNPRFMESIDRRFRNDDGFEFIIFDEAHCITQWGFQFRPDYFYALEEIKKRYRKTGFPVRIMLLSATVTKATEIKLQALLNEKSGKELIIRPQTSLHPIQSFIHLQPEHVKTGLYGRGKEFKILERGNELIIRINEPTFDAKKSIIIIFVRKRSHAEDIAKYLRNNDLLKNCQYRIKYFHAGMPKSDRERIYELVCHNRLDILIATKAFGMGMDVPNIHFCYHLAPPTFLEDYLQEVGRSGRDQGAKDNPDKIECWLLKNPEDFKRNHELLKRNMIQPHDLTKLWEELWSRSAIIPSGQRISIFSVEGIEGFNENRLKIGLSWLERTPPARIAILGILPDMLPIYIDRDKLENCSIQDNSAGMVARAILRVYMGQSEPNISEGKPQRTLANKVASSEKQGGLWGFLRKCVGFLFQQETAETEAEPVSQAIAEEPVASQAPSQKTADINLKAVFLHAGLSNITDMYRALPSLESAKAIKIKREISFKPGMNKRYKHIIFNAIGALIREITKDISEKAQTITLDRLIDIVYGIFEENEALENSQNEIINDEHEATNDAEVFRKIEEEKEKRNKAREGAAQTVIRGTSCLLKRSGLTLQEIEDDNVQQYSYLLTQAIKKSIIDKANNSIRIAEGVCRSLSELNDKPIELSKLFELIDSQSRFQDLEDALRLLAELKLLSSEQRLIPQSYIVEVTKSEPLKEAEEVKKNSSDYFMYEELDTINSFAELRSSAMEFFAELTTEQERRNFIKTYFDAGSPEDLEKLLGNYCSEPGAVLSNDQLKNLINDPETPEATKRKLTILFKARQLSIKDELDELKKGEEPGQYKAVSSLLNKNILVNAGPGAGKTHVLMLRAAYLIHYKKLQPEKILILAFNRAVVHEIKARIKRLFDGLGYGAYVRGLKVYTFHSFALSNLSAEEKEKIKLENSRTVDKEKILDQYFNYFVDKCSNDKDFVKKISPGIRAILVDEFQDMNDKRYKLLQNLCSVSAASIMAIGDDDQDIIRWDRIEKFSKSDEAKEAVSYFKKFKEDFTPLEVNLCVNFRSAGAIVTESNAYIEKALSGVSDRIKTTLELKPRSDASAGHVDSAFEPTIEKLQDLLKKCSQQSDEIGNRRSCAILCRSNAEVAYYYESLRNCVRGLQIQGEGNLKLNCLRHIAVWVEVCTKAIENQEDPILDDVIWKELIQRCNESGIPELLLGGCLDIRFLWDCALEENPRATISYFIDFVAELRTDDYNRMLSKTKLDKWVNWREESLFGKYVISTIHKLKGLEFDTVVIIPSNANFPFGKDFYKKYDSLKSFSADEARSWYVAMTRARTELRFSYASRENAWMQCQKYEGITGGNIFLAGDLDEIHISWPGENNAIQEYIHLNVHCEDRITLSRDINNKIKLNHNGTIIGHLSNPIADKLNNCNLQSVQLKVHAVYRYPFVDNIYTKKVTRKCKAQGWYYTVLVSGFISAEKFAAN